MDKSKRLERCECCGKVLVEWSLDGDYCEYCQTPTPAYAKHLDDVYYWDLLVEEINQKEDDKGGD